MTSCFPTKDYKTLQEDNPENGREYKNLETAVLGIFDRQKLVDNAMKLLQVSIKALVQKDSHKVLFDWCLQKLFINGMELVLERVKYKKGKDLLNSVDDTWNFFYTQTLPTLEALFVRVKVPKVDMTIRKAALISFRDNLLLKLDILLALDEVNFSVSPGIKHMFLILQSVFEEYPPSANKQDLEKLVSRVIIPYLGYRGYYEGGPQPVIESMEPAIHTAQRRSLADIRRVSRPLSVQPEDMSRLNESYKLATAAIRTTSLLETTSVYKTE